jgi:cytochrome b561
MAIWKYGWALRIDQYFISLVKRRSVHPHVIFRVYDDRLSDGVENLGMSLLLLATGRLMHRLLGQVVRSPSWRIHYGLYTGIIAMPLSGWILSSSAGYPPKIFGIALPIVSAGRQWLTSSAWYAHFIIAFLMIITIATHIADLLLSYRQGKRLIMRMWLQ